MHWFIEPIKNHYVDFSGRATRQQFWMFILLTTLGGLLFQFIPFSITIGLIGLIYQLGLVLPTLAIMSRRLHDIGKTSLWLLLIVPVIIWVSGSIGFIYMGFVLSGNTDYSSLLFTLPNFVPFAVISYVFTFHSQPGVNKWGSNPYGVGVTAEDQSTVS